MLNDTIDRNRQRRRRIHSRRRQRVRRQLMLIGAVLLLVIMSIISCTANHIHKKKAQEAANIEKELFRIFCSGMNAGDMRFTGQVLLQ